MAGHPGKILFAEDWIEKQVAADELETYQRLDEFGVRRFVPELISTTDRTIKIENLLKGTDTASCRFIDLKLGTSTMTKKAKLIPGKLEHR